jgi:ferredoxin-fold anticodon binding domain-containing protein
MGWSLTTDYAILKYFSRNFNITKHTSPGRVHGKAKKRSNNDHLRMERENSGFKIKAASIAIASYHIIQKMRRKKLERKQLKNSYAKSFQDISLIVNCII